MAITASEIYTDITTYILTGGKRTLASGVRLVLNKIVVFIVEQVAGITSGGAEVTNTTKRNALKTGTNWVNPAFSGDSYYPIMTLNIVTGQNEFDYYIGFDSVNTTTLYRYSYEKIDSVLTWIRTPISLSIATS